MTRFSSLQESIQAGLELTRTKQLPPSRPIGDWQSVETVYGVVARQPFFEWRDATLAYLEATFGFESEEWWAFLEECRYPWFLELLEGLKLLKQIALAHPPHPHPSPADC